MGRARWTAPLAALALFFLLHTDNLALKLLALTIYALLFGIAALRAGRLRALLLIDLLVTVLITALLLVSAETFVHYRWGWLAHEIAALTLLIAASGRMRPFPARALYWLLIGGSALSLTVALILLLPYFTLVDFGLVLWTLGALPLLSAALIGERLTITTDAFRRPLLVGLVLLGVLVSLWSFSAFPNWSATDEATIVDTVDTYQRTGVIAVSMAPDDPPTVTGNLYVYAARLWQSIFPSEPMALRVFSAVGGLALIAVVFAVTRALADALTAWIAAALLATNLLWLAATHVARQEAWLAVVVWGAVGLTLAARQRRSRALALLSGWSSPSAPTCIRWEPMPVSLWGCGG